MKDFAFKKDSFINMALYISLARSQDTFSLLNEHGMKLKVVTITAKEKVCVLESPDCNPENCRRAKGHYDRVNDAVYDMLTNEEQLKERCFFFASSDIPMKPIFHILAIVPNTIVLMPQKNENWDRSMKLFQFTEHRHFVTPISMRKIRIYLVLVFD